MMTMAGPGAMTVAEASQYLGVDRQRVDYYRAHGYLGQQLRSFRYGGRIYVSRSDVEAIAKLLGHGDVPEWAKEQEGAGEEGK